MRIGITGEFPLRKTLQPLFIIFLVSLLFPSRLLAASEPSSTTIEALFQQGLAAYHKENFRQAIACWEQGLQLSEIRGARKLTATFASNLGLAHAGLGDAEAALPFYEKALNILHAVNDLKNVAITLNNMGAVCNDAGNYGKALDFYQQSLILRRQSGDRRGEANTLTNLGAIHAAVGDYKNAFTSINEAMTVYAEIMDKRGEMAALINLGSMYADIGQYDTALTCCQKALDISRLLEDPARKSEILGNMGAVYLLKEEPGPAIDHFNLALAATKTDQDPKSAAANLSNRGVAYKQRGDLDKALESYQKSLDIQRASGNRPGEGAVLGNLALVLEKMGKYEQADPYATQSLDICMASGLPEYQWRALRARGKIDARLGRRDAAETHYLLAVETIEKMRGGLAQGDMKASFMQSKTHVYDELIELYGDLHKTAPDKGFDRKSFEIFEKKQSRVFLEEMGRSGARRFSGIPDPVIAEDSRLTGEKEKIDAAIESEYARAADARDSEKIKALTERSAAVEEQIQTLTAVTKTDYPDYYALKYPKPAGLADLQTSVIRPGEVLLAYNIMESSACLWVIARDHFSMHPIDRGEKYFSDGISDFRDNDINIFKGQALRGAEGSDSAAPAKSAPSAGPELYRLLFPETMRKLIGNYQTVYIVPTGPLYLLPFEALKNDQGRYLVETQAFAYLSSASLLKVLRDAEKRRGAEPAYPFLAFANPVYDVPKEINDTVADMQIRSFYSILRGTIEPLPETEDEVTRIKNILKAPENSRPLQVRQNASRSMLYAFNNKGDLDDYRYLSFACHGIIPDAVNGVTQPSLLLSTPDPETKEIGLLTMADVFGLKLNADLVSLSACNTARGKIIKGEGVMGLTRAFMYAGTPAISVTLWSVETISAQQLNVAVFQTLQKGESRAEALRRSKMKLITGEFGAQFQHPFFWAPMILFGDGT
jgi:CHAT domain-containing protein/Tfp pilus assembly protein PilF